MKSVWCGIIHDTAQNVDLERCRQLGAGFAMALLLAAFVMWALYENAKASFEVLEHVYSSVF
jgi:high-affinity Fe2+/Pb2+ permease